MTTSFTPMISDNKAAALRAAGYLPLPRWWVTADQMKLVEFMVRQNSADVQRIKASVVAETDIDRAWKHHERGD